MGALSVPLAGVSFLCCVVCVIGCGVVTHIDSGHRAVEFFGVESEGVNYRELLQNHDDAFMAGNPYPDAMYPDLCENGIYHDVAEDTHWTPFIEVSVNYIRDTYPKPWNATTEKLVSFLLGIVSHQVADVNWHSLGISQGFLRTMGMINYHGSFGAAHSDGDFGGDVVAEFSLDMEFIPLLDRWYVPVKDLVEIYKRYYGTARVTEDVITRCSRWMYLARLGEGLGVIQWLYPIYARYSPFLADQYDTFFLGGVDDMATWTANVMRRTVKMLDEGTGVCDLPENPIYIRCDNETKTTEAVRMMNPERNPGRRVRNLEAKIGDLDQDDVVTEVTDRGVYFTPSPRMQNKLMQTGWESTEYGEESLSADTLSPTIFYDTNHHYSRLGQSLASGDLNNDGFEDLIIGAPGYSSLGNSQQGRVYVVYGSPSGLPQNNLTLERDASVTLDGRELNGRFGSSLAVVDLNADGRNDLAVSAPTTGSQDLTFHGEVYVYFGQEDGPLSTEPDVTITCQTTYCNLGSSLAGSDLDGEGHADLVVGSPFAPSGGEQRGFVGVLYAQEGYTGGHLSEESFDWTWAGSQDYEWAGHKVSVQHSAEKGSWLFISAPTFRICARPDCVYEQSDIQAVGRLYMFQTPLQSEPSHTITGGDEFEGLGSSAAIGNPYGDGDLLAVTSLYKSVPGRVEERESEAVQAGQVSLHDLDLNQKEVVANIAGDRHFSRAGETVMFSDINGDSVDDMIMTAPKRTAINIFRPGVQEGQVLIFNGGATFPRGENTQECEGFRTQPCSTDKADVVIRYDEEKSRFGSAVTAIKSQNKVDVVVSATYSNRNGRLSGRVCVISL